MTNQQVQDYKKLIEEIKNCNKCELCKNKENKVAISRKGKNFKLGTKLFIIGEASGREEAKEGSCFIGRSGQVLDEWLKVLSKDNDFFIANVVKNRPTIDDKDRTPTQQEIDACLPYLKKQIEIIKPQLILCLGNTAFKSIVSSNDKITESIGKSYEYQGIKVLTFYHPSYVLRHAASNWQEELQIINKMINKDDSEIHGEQLYKSQGVARSLEMGSLKGSKTISNKFSKFPMLGLRSDYSFLEFGGKMIEEVKYLKENGAEYVNFCDDNSTANFLKLTEFCKETKMKPIYGTTLIGKNVSFSLLVKDEEGFKNLNKIVTKFNTQKDLNSEVIEFLIENKNGLMLVYNVDTYNVNYGIELIDNEFENDLYIGFVPTNNLKLLMKYSLIRKEHPNAKTILFNRNCMVKPEDHKLYLVLKSIKEHKYFDEIGFKNSDRYLWGEEEISKLIVDKFGSGLLDEIIKNTNEITTKSTYIIPKRHNLLPEFKYNFDVEISEDDINKFIDIFDATWMTREELEYNTKFYKYVKKFDLSDQYKIYSEENHVSIDEAKSIYDKRINMELEMIYRKKFVDYMLIVKMICDYATKNNIVQGAGRGSVGGSEVAYALGIIKIDAINNGLIFERFLNDFKDIPDIDIDFQSGRRKEIINYLIEYFTEEKIVYASTILTFKFKSALNEVGKVLRIPKYVTDEIGSKIVIRTSGDARYGNIISDTFNFNPELNKYKEEYKEFFELSTRVEGIKRTIGTHASGIMAFREPYYNYTSLNTCNSGLSTSYEFTDMESYGLVKIDILGIAALDTMKEVCEKNNIKIDYNKPDGIGLNDEKVFELFKKGNTAGIFEVGTPAMTNVGKTFVENFYDIIALNAIVRPASLRYGMGKKYMNFKATKKPISYGENTDKILNEQPIFKRYGNLLLFQEQVMLMFNRLANFYLVDSNVVIKAISKSKGVTTFFEQFGQRFIDGCKKNGIDEAEAKQIFSQLFNFGSFAFNLAHSTLYGYDIYYLAWLKANYPYDFYCAALNNSNDSEKNRIFGEMIENSFNISEPDFNISDGVKYIHKDGVIYMPLKEIKYLTKAHIEKIILNRNWKDGNEVINKLKLPKRVSDEITKLNQNIPIESLVKNPIKNTIILKRRKNEIINYVSTTYKITELSNIDFEYKTNNCVVQLVRKPYMSAWGDWLKDQTKPTPEQIKNDKKTYGNIEKYGWMSKYSKFAIKDLDGNDGFLNVYPDVYEKYKDIIQNLKSYKLLLVKLKRTKKSYRGELLEMEVL